MGHRWVRAIWCLALAVMTAQLTAEAQQTATRRITVTVAREVEPFAGIIMHPLPPSTASQRVISWEMFVKTSKGTTKAELGHEAGRFQKPILTVAASPHEKMQLILKLEIDLLQAPGPVRVGRTVPTLTEEERAGYTEAGLEYEHEAESFRAWMKANGLVKGKKQSDIQFAAQLLAFMRAKFIYKGPDEDYKRAKIAELGSGELGFFTSEWSGECLRYPGSMSAFSAPTAFQAGWSAAGCSEVGTTCAPKSFSRRSVGSTSSWPGASPTRMPTSLNSSVTVVRT